MGGGGDSSALRGWWLLGGKVGLDVKRRLLDEGLRPRVVAERYSAQTGGAAIQAGVPADGVLPRADVRRPEWRPPVQHASVCESGVAGCVSGLIFASRAMLAECYK